MWRWDYVSITARLAAAVAGVSLFLHASATALLVVALWSANVYKAHWVAYIASVLLYTVSLIIARNDAGNLARLPPVMVAWFASTLVAAYGAGGMTLLLGKAAEGLEARGCCSFLAWVLSALASHWYILALILTPLLFMAFLWVASAKPRHQWALTYPARSLWSTLRREGLGEASRLLFAYLYGMQELPTPRCLVGPLRVLGKPGLRVLLIASLPLLGVYAALLLLSELPLGLEPLPLTGATMLLVALLLSYCVARALTWLLVLAASVPLLPLVLLLMLPRFKSGVTALALDGASPPLVGILPLVMLLYLPIPVAVFQLALVASRASANRPQGGGERERDSLESIIALLASMAPTVLLLLAAWAELGQTGGNSPHGALSIKDSLLGMVVLTMVPYFYLGLALQSVRMSGRGVDISHVGFVQYLAEKCYPESGCFSHTLWSNLGLLAVSLIAFLAGLGAGVGSIDIVALLSTIYIVYLKRLYFGLHSTASGHALGAVAEYIDDILESSKPCQLIVGYGIHGMLVAVRRLLFSTVAAALRGAATSPEGHYNHVDAALVPTAADPAGLATRNFDPTLVAQDIVVVERRQDRVHLLRNPIAYVRPTASLKASSEETLPEPRVASIAPVTPISASAVPALGIDAAARQLDIHIAALPSMLAIITTPDDNENTRVIRNISETQRREPQNPGRVYMAAVIIESNRAIYDAVPVAAVSRTSSCSRQISYPYGRTTTTVSVPVVFVQAPSSCYAAWSLAARL